MFETTDVSLDVLDTPLHIGNMRTGSSWIENYTPALQMRD